MGEHDINAESDGMVDDIEIAGVKIHYDFDEKTGENDIAIITLARDVKFSGE